MRGKLAFGSWMISDYSLGSFLALPVLHDRLSEPAGVDCWLRTVSLYMHSSILMALKIMVDCLITMSFCST